MSIALLVLLAADQSPAGDAWQGALDTYKVPIHFSPLIDTAQSAGRAPLRLRGQESGFVFRREDYAHDSQTYPELRNVQLKSPVVYCLSYQNYLDAASAYYAASALVAGFGGVAFDPQGRAFLTEKQLLDVAKKLEALARRK